MMLRKLQVTKVGSGAFHYRQADLVSASHQALKGGISVRCQSVRNDSESILCPPKGPSTERPQFAALATRSICT